jgi:hypothetical protein
MRWTVTHVPTHQSPISCHLCPGPRHFLASQHHNLWGLTGFRPPDDVVLSVTDGISKEARRCEVRLTLPQLVRLSPSIATGVKSSPRHAQIAPTNSRNVGSPLDKLDRLVESFRGPRMDYTSATCKRRDLGLSTEVSPVVVNDRARRRQTRDDSNLPKENDPPSPAGTTEVWALSELCQGSCPLTTGENLAARAIMGCLDSQSCLRWSCDSRSSMAPPTDRWMDPQASRLGESA